MSGSVLKKYLTMENLQRWAGAAAIAVGVGLAAPAVAADSPSGLRGTPDPNLDCKEVTVKQAAKPATPPAVHPVVRPRPTSKPAVAEGDEDKPKAAPKKRIHRPKPAAATPEKTMWECQPRGTPLQSYPKGGPTSPFAGLVPGFKPGAPLPPFLRPPVAALPPSGGTPLPPTGVAPPPPQGDQCVNLDALLKDNQGRYLPDKVAQTKGDFPELSKKCGLPDFPNVPPPERPKTPTDGPQIPPPPRDDIPNQVPEPGTLALVGAAAAALFARRPGKAGAVIKKAFD